MPSVVVGPQGCVWLYVYTPTLRTAGTLGSRQWRPAGPSRAVPPGAPGGDPGLVCRRRSPGGHRGRPGAGWIPRGGAPGMAGVSSECTRYVDFDTYDTIFS